MEDNIDSLIARIQEYRVEEEIEDDFSLSRDSYSMEAYQSNPLSYMYAEEFGGI